jgi:hypothetical protein
MFSLAFVMLLCVCEKNEVTKVIPHILCGLMNSKEIKFGM